jgi:AraC-like DNA-binding protein
VLDEEVHVYPPDSFPEPGSYLRLQRALYGLRRSPLLWLQELTRTLQELGLKPVPESRCLFTNSRILVFFYVDDIVIAFHRKHEAEYQNLQKKLLQKYKFNELGELKWFLGIRILRDRTPGQKKLWLCQDSYIKKIARSFNLTDRYHFTTPMATEEVVPNPLQATPREIHAFQTRIGSTTYATTITRPDAARASNKLAEFLTNPSAVHIAAANRIIRYLYNTRYLALEYSQRGSTLDVFPDFRCSTDAAYGDDFATRKSTEGYLFKLFGGPIDWRSTRQKTVTKSSTESELLALSHAASEIYWWRRFYDSIGLNLDEYIIECDNQQTIRLVTSPAIKLATKLKHVDIHHHWLRQEVADQRLQIDWIPTAEMPADGLTKSLPRQKHQTFIKQLGLIDIRDRVLHTSTP